MAHGQGAPLASAMAEPRCRDPPTDPASPFVCSSLALIGAAPTQVEAIAAKLASAYKEEAVVSTFKREQGEAGGQEGAEAATPMQVETGAAAAEAEAAAATPKVGNSEREFAVGLLSEYLSPHWTGLLAKHLGVRTPDECTKVCVRAVAFALTLTP